MILAWEGRRGRKKGEEGGREGGGRRWEGKVGEWESREQRGGMRKL